MKRPLVCTLAATALLLLCTPAHAEKLTVRVVDADTGKPLSGIVVQLHPDPCQSGKHKATEAKSNRDGAATFDDVNVSAVPWSVSVYSVGYEQQDADAFIASPEIAKATTCSASVVSTFPAEITLHLRRRGWMERVEYLIHSI